MLAVRAADWPLLTGGRYSEVVVRTGLTVLILIFKYPMAFLLEATLSP
jgi:hypothetical protein